MKTKKMRRRKAEGGRRRDRGQRRGVLLLVVLSMLVLFMLIGTAFLMTASQSRVSATNAARAGRVGNHATKQLERALFQLVRDTDNPHSVMFTHSLLRDQYGTQGFQGVVYSPIDPPTPMDLATVADQVTRFSGATAAVPLGPTAGQFVDIYVRQLGWNATANPPNPQASLNDPFTTVDESAGTTKLLQPDLRHIIKLDRGVTGQSQLMALPLTKGYFNGCLLTVTSGSAAGQTGRILDYEFIGNIDPSTATATTRLFRFRVMTFQRSDGQPLQIGSRSPEIADLAGATFIVNGRAYSGTGPGYNPLAAIGQAKLSALQFFPLPNGDMAGAEIALLPNALYFNPLANIGAAPGVAEAFATPIPAANVGQIPPLNNVSTSIFNYPRYVGPGDANESYDAADYNNMFLALQSVTPRAQGRVVQNNGGTPVTLSAFDPGLVPADFLRLDLEDVPLPSFHRPDLINFWYHRLLKLLSDPSGQFAMAPDEAALAILDPYPSGVLRAGLSPQAAALITAIKRQSSMRPLREDHPNFDGSNRLSVPTGLPTTGLVDQATGTNFMIPYWQAVGPWDLDNDNDGVPDSIWIDLGDPIQEAEDGTRYKALYAFLVIDLDSRLNVNAHGLADHINPAYLAVSYDLNGNPQTGAAAKNLAGSTQTTAFNSNMLAQGVGYGPAEISLRPVFPVPLDNSGTPFPGNRSELVGPIDSYAAAMIGRLKLDGTGISGKLGFNTNENYTAAFAQRATPGLNYTYVQDPNPMSVTGEIAQPDLAVQIKFCGYPWVLTQRSCFGTPPDLFGRYSVLGLDYMGAPVYEVLNDTNEMNSSLPRPLLRDIPYELNLSGAQRNDQWASNSQFADSTQAFNQSLVQNDDAPFSPTDLEKVLRAWDADHGTLPSRLWDATNAFDPLKLMNQQYGDPYRVAAISQASFGAAGPSEIMATAQQIAGINRRLITSISFGLPVSGGSVPNQTQLSVGADGASGRLQSNGSPGVLNDPVSDDFRSLFGKEVAQATIFDLLRYRVWKQVRTEYMLKQSPPLTEAALAGMNAADYAMFLTTVSQFAEARLNGEGGADIDGNGVVDPPLAQLLAADVVAGLRMDVNRPFGDGVDLDGNLVVDDPLEAGEPFLDVNGNGKRDNGEPFIDLDGNQTYLAPQDKLWLWQNLTAEPIEFDYTNGQADRVYKGTIAGGVRNLEAQGRQHYARNLYCMMLLLMDENYIAPWDENDPQLMSWMDAEKAKLTAAPLALPADQADLIVKRKHTCRMVAQWAINCADMRDADVISTPFEYDENPWDGWGVLDAKLVNIPLDGDAATDENKGELIDWTTIANGGNAGAPKTFKTVVQADLPTLVNQTRGIVWGAERPELLITETLAFHDRRTEDLSSTDSNGHSEMIHYNNPGEGKYGDPDPDQSMRPRGSAFVELYNPSSPTGQFPAEVYARLDGTTGYQPTFIDPNDPTKEQYGIDMARLSNLAWDDANSRLTTDPSNAANKIKRSPVWRLIVVEEWPGARNADVADDKRLDKVLAPNVKEPAAYTKMATKNKSWQPTAAEPNPPFRPTDPDFDAAFDANFLPKQKASSNSELELFEVSYPYIEREFYFTTDKSPLTTPNSLKLRDWNYAVDKFKLRIPDRAIPVSYPADSAWKPETVQTQKFIAYQLERASPNQPAIAPILPQRYAVIGSAGEQNDDTKQIYRTTIGRPYLSNLVNTNDNSYRPDQTRRIEMRPGADPNVQQLAVTNNGGDPKDDRKPSSTAPAPPQTDPTTVEIGRDNELINDNGTVKNVYGSKPGADGTLPPEPNSRYFQPTVSIPVEGMSVSEPAWGYGPAEFKSAEFEKTKKGNGSYLYFKKTSDDKYQGRYYKASDTAQSSYDKPFDGYGGKVTAPELVRTGTTPNYRTIHLQRLANPLLPWNPTPKLANGKPNKDHRPNMPVNPYRTVDTASIDLTAFNGATQAEGAYPSSFATNMQGDLSQYRPWIGGEREKYLENMDPGNQAWHFRSSERGAWARLNVAGSAANPATSPPQRLLWAQEPAMVKFKKPLRELYDLIPSRQMTMRVTEELPDQVKDDQKIRVENHMNMVMEHSLGFGNESFGLLYDAQGSLPGKTEPPSAAAIGAPAPGFYTWDDDGTNAVAEDRILVQSTNPWLHWGNRPYVSSEELLNVPAGSSSTMLRFYSAGATANPYDGTGLDAMGQPVPNMVRLAAMRSPFGQLMNFTQTAVLPAQLVTDAMGNPVKDANGQLQFIGAPNFYRILDYVQVPSRFVGTETMLNAETFNDVSGVADSIGMDLTGPGDPRYAFQPPFNKISRQRDPGRVNLNTVMGRKGNGRIWSDVFDGIMHRDQDRNLGGTQLGHLGPAWRDIVLSRRGYAQVDAIGGSVDKPGAVPDALQFGLNKNFPTFFSNPFRSPDAGDLVPLQSMVHYGVDAGWLRRHHFNRGGRPKWGTAGVDDNNDNSTDDTRKAGYGGDDLVVDVGTGALLPVASTTPFPTEQSGIPLLSESFSAPYYDGDRNPYNYYQPMSRLGNLVTNRSGVFGVWITVGYFEVEKAPDFATNEKGVADRCGNDISLYNRIYPDGYMLGRELGVDTGDVKRARGFYIIDRTEEVGFKPGEDLNVEKLIRLRRRIE